MFLSLYDLLDNITCEEVWIYVIYFRDLGAQIDGFIAVAAHTVVVGASTVGIERVQLFLETL